MALSTTYSKVETVKAAYNEMHKRATAYLMNPTMSARIAFEDARSHFKSLCGAVDSLRIDYA